jgi:hypothetical protein
MSFLKRLARHQAKNGVLPGLLSPDPEDYVGRRHRWGQHFGGVYDDACEVCRTEGRCSSTLPPFKYEAQQCDGQSGHLGLHWFHDGWTRYVWEGDHMTWCGLDLDHEGMCHPALPISRYRDDGTRPEPGPCGHKRPFEYPGGVTCTLDEGHEGCHSAPYKPEYTWVNDTDPKAWPESYSADVWDDETSPYVLAGYETREQSTCESIDPVTQVACDRPEDHSLQEWHSGVYAGKRRSWPVVVRTYDEVWGDAHKEEPVRAVCWAPDQTGTRRCDLDDGHHGVHSGGRGYYRESWPPCCCEEHRVGSMLCGSCPVHDGPYRTEGLEPPPEPTQEGTEAPEDDLGVIVLRGIIEALTAALKEIE